MKKIRVFLADDHQVLRDGLRSLLEVGGDIEVVGEAADGREALAAIGRAAPDIAILDISMPLLDGVQLAAMLHARLPALRIIMLSMVADAEVVYRALRAGAHGYLVKASAGREVLDAVRAVHQGRRYLSDDIAETIVEGYAREVEGKSPLESLSARERQVLQLLGEGRSAAEIGRLISVSPRTVETYRARLMEKLSLKDFHELVVFAVRHGVVPPAE